jgi:hypothetical protein
MGGKGVSLALTIYFLSAAWFQKSENCAGESRSGGKGVSLALTIYFLSAAWFQKSENCAGESRSGRAGGFFLGRPRVQ